MKKLEARQARKEFRKMMKQSGIAQQLEELEDYSSFYDNPEQPEGKEDEEENKNANLFETKREQQFYEYGQDIDFVRHHKRTVRNFKTHL